jgi:hypothetical protein
MTRLLFALAFVFLFVTPAYADGGTPVASALQAGPYDLTVYSDTNPIRVGSTDMSVLILKRGTTEVVNGATVTITAEQEGRPTVTAQATRELATNKLFYASDLKLPNSGRWQFTVTIQGPDGEGSANFSAEAQRYAGPVDYAIYGAILFVLVAVGFLIFRRFRRGKKRSPRRA